MNGHIAPEFETGDRLDDYVILEKIDEAGSFIGYTAVDSKKNRHVSIKILRHTPEESKRDRERFKKMARRVAALSHPSLVPFFEEVEKEDLSYFVTEYIRGYTLQDWLNNDRTFDEAHAKDWLKHTAEALDYGAHSGIFHFDLKPSNFVVNWDNKVRLCNLGIEQCRNSLHGKETWHHDGAPEYSSPEHIRGDELDMRSDLYSLGALIYHFMVGEPPFGGDTIMEMREAHLKEAFPVKNAQEAEVPKPWIELMEELMQKDPTKRPQSYKKLIEFCS